nr:hypothetical protein [uncultured Oscillibacter sp.]
MTARKERYFHECPECGLLTPYLQTRCDCGYRFSSCKPKGAGNEIAIVFIILIISVFLNVFLLLSLFHDRSDATVQSLPDSPASSASNPISPSEYTPAEPILPTYTYVEVPIENGELVRPPVTEGVAPLTVNTLPGDNDNYYVYLQPSGNHGKLLSGMGFYVVSGESAEVSVPLGNYELYYATGSVWYGEDVLFGEDTSYYKCVGLFDFYEDDQGYSGWSVDLYSVPSGNLDTKSISAEDFPG